MKWKISIKFFKKHYLRSATKFDGLLTDPKKDLIYYLDLAKTKIKFIYTLLAIRISNE
jgi:hypothetical protein